MKNQTTRGRAALLTSLALCALTLAVLLGIGAIPQVWQLGALFLTCLLIAFVSVLLPSSLRVKLGPLVVAFIAAAGVVPLLLLRPAGDETAEPKVNAQDLAELVEDGPFSESLPAGLTAKGLAPVTIEDANAARRLGAVEVEMRTLRDVIAVDSIFAHMEVYPTEEDAHSRASASMNLLTRLHNTGIERQSPQSFCVYGDFPHFWTCAGFRGYVYAEVTLSPNPNANLPIATGTVAALLRYGDRMTQLAAN